MPPVLWWNPGGRSSSSGFEEGTSILVHRAASEDPYSVDLHGTTAYEATIIVKDILQVLPTSQCTRMLLHG